jgi:hypothetical protein
MLRFNFPSSSFLYTLGADASKEEAAGFCFLFPLQLIVMILFFVLFCIYVSIFHVSLHPPLRRRGHGHRCCTKVTPQHSVAAAVFVIVLLRLPSVSTEAAVAAVGLCRCRNCPVRGVLILGTPQLLPTSAVRCCLLFLWPPTSLRTCTAAALFGVVPPPLPAATTAARRCCYGHGCR